jgi:CBS domain-containing protein
MSKGRLLPQSRVWSVRADLPISECVRILRDHSVGALVVVSDDREESIVGIFTERDLVRHIELIHRGRFWESAVRTVMTARVHTITVAQISEAPRIMARHHIRHLPVVEEVKGRKRLVGVLSMRDVFRFVMEELDFDLGRIYRASEKPVPKARKKLIGVFSSDPAITGLLDAGARMTQHLLVRAAPLSEELENLPDLLERFDALFVDLDGLRPVEIAKVVAAAKAAARESVLFFAFNPARLEKGMLEEIQRVSSRKRVHLLAKPVALGLLYEKFLREI